MVIMLVAIGLPRVTGSHAPINWALTLGAGGLTAALVLGVGYTQRARRSGESAPTSGPGDHAAVEEARG
jgi:hypothetical protein